MPRAVLRWDVPLDTAGDASVSIGAGPVRLVGWRPDRQESAIPTVEVWTEETWPDEAGPALSRRVLVVGTGHPIPYGATHLGSVIAGAYVWHIYEESTINPYEEAP